MAKLYGIRGSEELSVTNCLAGSERMTSFLWANLVARSINNGSMVSRTISPLSTKDISRSNW